MPKSLYLLILQLALLPALLSQTSEQLRANLSSLNTNGTLSLTDGNLTLYNISSSNAIDEMDAVKMTNFGENFGLLRGATTLAIEHRQRIAISDTIFFSMWNMRQKNYSLALFLKGLEHSDLTGVLEDAYLETKTLLNLNGANSLAFTITGSTASSASNRFRIIFSQASSFKVLPVTFAGIKAYRQNNHIAVEWRVENEKEISKYQVQTSVNGRQFFAVATITAKGKSPSLYNWADYRAVDGNNFYRITSIDINGKTQYSNIIKISAGIEEYPVSVYPNPIANGNINIKIANQPKGVYTTRLINNYGQEVYRAQLLHNGGSITETLQVKENAGKGNYILEIISPDNSKIDRKILIQ